MFVSISVSVMSNSLDPMDHSLPGSSVHGILQARILEWVTIPFSRGSPRPRDRIQVSFIIEGFFTICESEVAQSCPTLCNHMDCSLPGSSVHGVSQARILEWAAIFFSSRSSQPRNWTRFSRIVSRCFTVRATREASLPSEPLVKIVRKINFLEEIDQDSNEI